MDTAGRLWIYRLQAQADQDGGSTEKTDRESRPGIWKES